MTIHDIQEEARIWARQNIGGMQPVTTIGEKVELAYIAGATRLERNPAPLTESDVREALSAVLTAESDVIVKIIAEEVYGPEASEGWKTDNAQAALHGIIELIKSKY